MKKENGVSKILIVLIIFVLLCVLGVVITIITYNSLLKPVQSNSEKVIVSISEGSGVSGIATELEKSGVIKNADVFKIYCKINKSTSMKAGKYELDKNMSVEDIIKILTEGKVVDETVTITFIEGINMRKIAAVIEEKTENTEEDVFNLLQDEEYIDSLIEKYWFIDKSIKNEEIYYSLEGYLYPDTYTLTNVNVDVKTIFGKMLDKMDSVLSKYKTEIEEGKYSVHEILSLASIVELEARNEENRAEVAGVFYNRLKKGMPLQSDVTTYYAFKVDMSERDLTNKEINTKNPYNTRHESTGGKLTVGPICTVEESSIKAAVEPKETDALFFVADKNGKVYFSKNNAEHEEKIRELKNNGQWYEYDD